MSNIAVMSEDDFLDPSCLAEEHQWVTIRGPVSERTAVGGDWHILPHMQTRDAWKSRMGSRAQALSNFLERRQVSIDSCFVCSRNGAGPPSCWATHIAAPTHFKEMGRVCQDGVSIDSLREDMWESWRVPRGAIAFNHADGVVIMCKGAPTVLPGQNGATLPSQMQPPMAACVPPSQMLPMQPMPWQQVPPACAPAVSPMGGPPQGSLGVLDMCPEPNKWYKLLPPVGDPQKQGGDFNCCHWLQSRAGWKKSMKDPVQKLEEILTRYQIYPSCNFCPNVGDFAGHLPADKHFKNLCCQLQPGEDIRRIATAPGWTQQWNVPGGGVKWFHLHGQIAIYKGSQPTCESVFPLHPSRQALPAPGPTATGQLPAPRTGPTPHPPLPAPCPAPSPCQCHSAAPQAYPAAAAEMSASHWVWQNSWVRNLEELVEELTDLQPPTEELTCDICEVDLQVPQDLETHLASPHHFQNLLRKAGFGRQRWACRSLLQQQFSCRGAKMILDHWSLNWKTERQFAEADIEDV
ncbi:unnamed protein product [Effrenium voratum]|nr:unnamed protein product [Effrenium voratum]